MLDQILSAASALILNIISIWGYGGILFLMALESANIPIPSEVIMPFAGFLASTGRFDFAAVVLVGAIGNLLGSLINYGIAYRYSDKAAALLARLHLVGEDELIRAASWFHRRGLITAFLGRFIPAVRTFISFPAGMFRVDLRRFSLLTFVGSFLWSGALAYIGYVTGSNWRVLGPYFRQFDYLIVLSIIVLILFELKRRSARINRWPKS
jgi:membrane protein DedA with SNARE-associated domain